MPFLTSRARLSLLAAVAVVLVVVLFSPSSDGRAPAPPQESGMKVGRLMKTCERCHLDVWAEWQASGHARAWTNPAFQAAIADREDGGAECARCHAPDSIVRTKPGNLPLARSTDREWGVNCVTCHLNERLYYGPVASKAHGGVVVMEDYRTSDWCGSCHGHPDAVPHGEHYTEWQTSPALTEDEQNCQSCHMPEVERQLAESKRPLKDLQPAQTCRVHRFGVARDDDGVYEGAARIEGALAGGKLTVRIEPHGGHRVAVHTDHGVRLDVRLLDDAGGELATLVAIERVFPGEGEGALQPGVATEVTIDVPEAAAAAELNLRRIAKVDGRVVEKLATGKATRAE